jgi:hypothetical protein
MKKWIKKDLAKEFGSFFYAHRLSINSDNLTRPQLCGSIVLN